MKKIFLCLLILLLVTLATAVSVLYLRGNKIMAIKGGTLIDCAGNSPIENSIILIEKGKIKAVFRTGAGKTPLFARTIDGSGKFIIPGLIDMHVHFLDESFSALFLLNGVTTVRDMGNSANFILSLRDRINQGLAIGPKIFCSGYLINNRRIPFGASQYTAVVRTPKQVRKVVANLAKKKVDWIKIYFTLPRGLVRMIISQSRKYGIPVAGHLRNVNAELASRWGIRTLEHATGIAEALQNNESYQDAPPLWTISNKSWLHVDQKKYEDLIELFIKKNVYITANLTLYDGMNSSPEKHRENPYVQFMPKRFQDGWMNYLTNQFPILTMDKESWKITKQRLEEFLLLFKEKGGKVLAGTDTPWPYLTPGFSLHNELELLVQAGFSPLEALLTATRYPAEALNQEENLGTIEKSKIANLLVLKGNPLEDIRHTKNIDIIIKDGEVLPKEKILINILNRGSSTNHR